LEPYYLKRADRFIDEHIETAFTVGELAAHCGVSSRMLEKTFADFRGITPVAHMRNQRLDRALRALERDATVAEAARISGFASATTFALEFRRRYGVTPSRAKRVAETRRRAVA
jgi:AraC-like DNA-binding protein